MGEYRRLVNLFLGIIKYPLALVLLFSLPDMFLAFPEYARTYIVSPAELQMFFLGMAVFIVLYVLIVRKFNSYFETVVHEFTHLIFCILCGNCPKSINATFRNGGSVEYLYNGNWLISISPYFFPSFSVFLMILMSTKETRPGYSVLLLGFITAFQVISNYIQIHPKQTDFKKAGYLFTCIFLPPANVLMWGLILSYVDNGKNGMINYTNLAFKSLVDVLQRY